SWSFFHGGAVTPVSLVRNHRGYRLRRSRRRVLCDKNNGRVQWNEQSQLCPDEVWIDQDVAIRSNCAATGLEDFARPIGIAQQSRGDAAERVAGLDGVPPLAVHQLDRSRRLGDVDDPVLLDDTMA